MMLNQQNTRICIRPLSMQRAFHIVSGAIVVMCAFALALAGSLLGTPMSKASAAPSCGSGDKTYRVAAGDSLGLIAQRHSISAQTLARHNKLSNPDLIFVDQQICIPKSDKASDKSAPKKDPPKKTSVARGSYNSFPYGQCTWWANNRYHQVHGLYVPWMWGSDAWKWKSRAQEYGWKISSKPRVGSIIVLQANVQYSGGVGHVAYVEKVLSNGRVLTSNMNWGHGAKVVNVEFRSGPGVSYVYH